MITAFLLVSVATVSQASLLLYDGFNYADGSALRGTVSTIWSNNVTGSGAMATNRAGSLTYSGLPASVGGKVELAGYKSSSAAPVVKRILTTTYVSNTSLYASFILNIPTIGTVQSNGSISVFSLKSGQGHLVITNNASNPSKFNIGLLSTGGKAVVWDNNGGVGYDQNISYLIAISATNTSSGTTNAFAQLWVNPTLGQSSPSAAKLTTSIANIINSTIEIGVGVGNGAGDPAIRSVIYIDELRVGTTWADVTIPEPATVGMLGFGALVTLLIRRLRT